MLREASRPFKNLLEYHGITASRLEMMEARLRVRPAGLFSSNAWQLSSNAWQQGHAPLQRLDLTHPSRQPPCGAVGPPGQSSNLPLVSKSAGGHPC